MANPPPYPDTGDDSRVEPDREVKPGLARWQKVVGLIGLVVFVGLGFQIFAVGDHGPGGHAPGGDQEGNTPPINDAPEVAVTADALAFNPDRIELMSGESFNVTLTSADITHDLVVDEIDFHLAAERDETVFGELVFEEPGTYVGYCSVPGHREAGMELEIVVTPSDDPNATPMTMSSGLRTFRASQPASA